MLSPEILNPFLDIKSDHTDRLPAGDVPSLHNDIYTAMRDTVPQARQIKQGLGLTIVGEAGSGKSHLISRLRQHYDSDPRTVVVTLRLRTGRIGHLWRPVRKQLFEELLKTFTFKGAGSNGLLRILRNRFPNWAAALQDEGGLLGWLLGRRRQVDLKPYLDEFGRTTPLNHDLLKVLPQLSNPELSGLADQWLRGQLLGEDDLRRLGLAPYYPGDREQEDNASDVVQTFLKLAGEQTTLVLCFDEIEAIQSGNWDKAVLREFATMAVTMLGLSGPRSVITSLRFNLHTDLKTATDLTSQQKMGASNSVYVKVLEWEQMLQIVHSRLDAEPTCRNVRKQHPSGNDWPLNRKFLEELYRKHKRILTPRHVLLACSEEFQRLQTDGESDSSDRSDPPSGSVSPKSSIDQLLQKNWDTYAAKFMKKPESVKFDDVFGKGLPWLANITAVSFYRSEGKHPGIDDVNLVFFSSVKSHKPIGISLCNDPPTSLWRRLDRLTNQWRANRSKHLAQLHVLRFANERTTSTGQDRLEILKSEGAQLHAIPSQQLAEMAAYHAMLINVQNGDVTYPNGQPVSGQEYDAWVKTHIDQTHSVKELLDSLFGQPIPGPDLHLELVAAGKVTRRG